MIGHQMADAIRYADAVLCLALVAACAVAIALSPYWDQRVRYVIFGAFGALLTLGHLSAIGREGSYRLLILVVIVVAALVSTVAGVLRDLRGRRAR